MDDGGEGNTGGNDGTGTGNGWNDESSSTLWGWLDGIVSGLKSVWQAVVNLPSLIADSLAGLFNSVVEGLQAFKTDVAIWFNDVKTAILNLPAWILDGIESIFIPDTEYIALVMEDFYNELSMKFGIDTGFFENLFQGESAVDDVKGNYSIPGVGAFNLTFLDVSWIVTGVTYFRPFIRGFLVLLMMLYHIRQLIGFFGYNAGVVAGRSDHIEMSKKGQ